MDPDALDRRLEEAIRDIDAVRVLVEARLELAVAALTAVIVPRADRDVLAAAATLLDDPHLAPDELLIFVEPQRAALTAELADVDAVAAAAEARRLRAESVAVAGTNDHGRLMLLSQAARLDRQAIRRERAEVGLRLLDDDVIACARRQVGDRLLAWLRNSRDLHRFDAVMATLPPRSIRGVARTAHVLSAGLRYIGAIVDRRLAPMVRTMSALRLHAVIDDEGTEPGGDTTAVLPGSRDLDDAIKVVRGAVTAIERFRDFDDVDDDEVLWDRLLGDPQTRALLGGDADGAFVPEVVAARIALLGASQTIVDLEATLARPADVGVGGRARALPSSTQDDVDAGGGRLGRYQLVKRLGEGGMAQVWLARQEGPRGFQKDVVVKQILDDHAADPYFIGLFQKEARLIAGLQHPNIIHVFDLGVEGDRWFMAMELLRGQTFLELIQSQAPGTFPVAVAARVIADAARGLAYAHQQPVVHRDISPDNLFCTDSGSTTIIDFGVAHSQQHTANSDIKGKVPFMAPEVFRGDAIDGAVDVFALGVTLWFALAGHRPFRGRSLHEVMHAILETTAPAVNTSRTDIPDDINALLVAMLAPVAATRPAASDIERILMTHAASPTDVVALLP